MYKVIKASSTQHSVKLHVEFYPYERFANPGLKKVNVSGPTLLDALTKMVDRMGLYLTADQIEAEGLTSEDIIEEIKSSNGDGCDYIILLKNMGSGEVYIQEDYYEEEEDW